MGKLLYIIGECYFAPSNHRPLLIIYWSKWRLSKWK